MVVFPCSNCAAGNVAQWVDNTSNGSSVDLRGDDGIPLWIGGYQGDPGDDGSGNENPGHGDSGNGQQGDEGNGNGGTGQHGSGNEEGEGGHGEPSYGASSRGNRTGRTWGLDMTTVTTVLGLTPMALGIGRGADLRAPLAIAVIGGLISATALTLIVVPVAYDLFESMRGKLRALVGMNAAEAK